MLSAVIFDLDGVLIDSEQVWASAREQVAREHGGTWRSDSVGAMMGMSSPEWSEYMRQELGVSLGPDEIVQLVVKRVQALYREHLPLFPGAVDTLRSLAGRWRLGLASSANREIIALVLELAGAQELFAATVSSEEVARGKPSPDVYLEAARRLDVSPDACAAVEDSTNGLRAAAAASMLVIAVPNRTFPPSAESLRLADATVGSLPEISPALLTRLAAASP